MSHPEFWVGSFFLVKRRIFCTLAGPAIDGQAGTVLRIFREHQMCLDDAFLKKNWPNIRCAVERLIRHDSNGDGLVDGSQDHTLDAAWYGEIA